MKKKSISDQSNKMPDAHEVGTSEAEVNHQTDDLSDSDNRHNELFRFNLPPMWLYDLETLAIINVNKRAELNYGYSRDEFLNLSVMDLLPRGSHSTVIDAYKSVNPEDHQPTEGQHRKKDGTIVDVEISWSRVDYAGRAAVLIMVQDITPRKLAESDLRLIEERYSAFVKQSSDAIFLFELSDSPIDVNLSINEQINWLYEKAVITECNKTFAQSHGYGSPEEMQGFRIGQIFPRLARENLQYLGSFIENNYHISQIETKELNKEGSVTYFLNSLIGVVENEKLIRIWGAKQDISRIKKVEAEIRMLNKELEQRVLDRTNDLLLVNKELESFSYSVSHDLRSPLRAINGFTSLLKQNYSGNLDEKGRQFLNVIMSNIMKMENLIADLLRLSRISKYELNRTSVSMRELFIHTFNELPLDPQKEKITLKIGELPDADVDVSLLKIAISNLLSNAVKFSSKEKEQVIEIGYVNQTKNAYFIRDNGVGFHMADASRLFDVFKRLHHADEFEGTGVGLAIVHRIIQKHSGKIWAESEPGQGATFYFSVGSGQ